MILGLSAYLAMPATSPRAMHGGALRMLRQTLSTEVGQQRRVNSLAFAPLLSRARPHGDPGWLSSDHVGRLTLGLATTPTVTGQDFQVPALADYTALMTSGFPAETGARPTCHPGCRVGQARRDEKSRMTLPGRR
jgi:hypothetical protein